jgi:mannose-1-phosphate guanylyltransferase
MVLAAGRGERMQPLSCRMAKPALPVLNRPLLSYALRLLHRGGVQRVAINQHHLPDTVEKVARQWAPAGMELEFFHEEEILGTGGGVKNAESLLGQGPFLLSNGDFLLQMDPAAALETHRRSGAAATLVLFPFQEHLGYTPVWVADGRVVHFGEPHPGETLDARPAMFAGLHVVEPSILDRIPAGKSLGIVRPVYTDLLAEGGVLAAHMAEGAWLEFGNPAEYLRRSVRLLTEPYRSFLAELEIFVTGEDEGACVLGDGVRISDNAAFVGEAILDDGAAVGRDARAERVIVGKNAVISFGCTVSDSIVADGVILPPEIKLEHRIVLPRSDDLSGLPGAKRLEELLHFPL